MVAVAVGVRPGWVLGDAVAWASCCGRLLAGLLVAQATKTRTPMEAASKARGCL